MSFNITELITNSIKHAFSDSMNNKIILTLRKTKDGAMLEVRDNGKGFPEGIDLSASDSLGIKLVHSYVRQINGTIKFEGVSGARCIVDIPIEYLGNSY